MIVGAAEILKYPHGIAMHAVQVLPILALLGLRTGWKSARQLLAVGLASLGYVLVLVVSTLQAYSGRGGLTFTPIELGLLMLGALLLVGAGIAVLVGIQKASAPR